MLGGSLERDVNFLLGWGRSEIVFLFQVNLIYKLLTLRQLTGKIIFFPNNKVARDLSAYTELQHLWHLIMM